MITTICLPKTSGIYKIENLVNGKVYIGSSINIRTRITGHLSDLRTNKHCNKYLQYSFDKYGIESFSVEILIDCKEEDLIYYEEFFMNKYDSLNKEKGYNLDSFENGRNIKYNVQSGEDRKNAKVNYSVVRIIRYLYKKGERPYKREISEILNVSETIVRNIINRTKWKKLDFEEITQDEIDKAIEIKQKFIHEEYRKHLFKPFNLINKITREVLYFESVEDCGRHFKKHSNCIRNSLKRPKSFINKNYEVLWIKK